MQEGRQCLDRAGQIDSNDPATLAIKDKSNLVFGTKLLEERNFEGAKQVLDRVRLTGPFSNRALLGAGWVDAFEERFDRALVPWSILVDREVTDAAVQEAMLAVPYAYGKLNVHSKAALLYGSALERFGTEIDKLDESIKSIREGHFLKALVREELKQDANWVVKLRRLPQTPETYYLLELMASHDFQESLKNYLDLEQLRQKLQAWEGDLDAFEEIIEQRRTVLPAAAARHRPGISGDWTRKCACALEQRDRIEKRLKVMLVVPRPDYLATSKSGSSAKRLHRWNGNLTAGGAVIPTVVDARIERLTRRVCKWNIYTEYDRRFTEAYKHLQDLNSEIDLLKKQYTAFVRTRQAATQSYQGYGDTIRRQRILIREAHERVGQLMARQGHMLELMAVNELSRRRDRLAEFQIKARFAMADSYDRATRAQTQERVGQ